MFLLLFPFNQVAGYVTEYEQNEFKFVTVKGAGHMASHYNYTE